MRFIWLVLIGLLIPTFSASADEEYVCAAGSRGSESSEEFYCSWNPAPSLGEDMHQLSCMWTAERGHALTVYAASKTGVVWVPVVNERINIDFQPTDESCE